MSLATQITSLAGRIAIEIKAVRAELASGLSGKASTSHTHTLDNLSDVVITTPSTGQVVLYNGTSFVNGTASAAVADGSVTDAKIVSGGLAPTSIAGTAVITTDSRLSNARTPTSHASSHGSAGSDPITVAPSQVTGTAVITTDSRLSDARTPTAHIHAQSEVTGLVTALAAKASLTTGTAFPAGPTAGQMFLNTTTKCSYMYNGTGWDKLSRPNDIEPMLLIGI